MDSMNINFKLFFSVITVNLLAFATGSCYAWSSAVLIPLQSNNTQINPLDQPATPLEQAWIISLLSLGASVGPFIAAYCSHKIGRKKTLQIFALPLLASHVILIFANSIAYFFVGRFIMGIGAGSVASLIPVYVGEIAETKNRGLVGFFLSMFSSTGILFVYVIGPYVNITSLSFVLMIPVILFYILSVFLVPESPYYYAAKGETKAAEISLSKVRKSGSSLLKELNDITELVEESKNNETSFFRLMKSRSFRKGITITVTLVFFQEFVGITILFAYMVPIFAATGTKLSSSTSAIIVASIQIITIMVTSSLVDRWGRRLLLIIACTGCAISLAAMGVFFYMKNTDQDVSYLWWLPTSSLMIYMVAYSFGLGAVPWVLVGELFSSKTKGFASSFTAFVCLILAFLVTFIFPTLEQLVGFHGSFLFFAANAVFALIFVLCYVPETKGKSFQDILKMLEN